jgi:Domain of unknown function (DUF5063)
MSQVEIPARERITAAIRPFLAMAKGERPGQGLKDLAKALDGLVMCYHATPDVEPDTIDGSAAPPVDDRSLEQAIGAAFPELGWYATANPQDDVETQVGLAIAASDLAEISADLIEVLWLFEHAGPNDAIWEFRFGYQTHWGRHLHELRTYLHSLAAY